MLVNEIDYKISLNTGKFISISFWTANIAGCGKIMERIVSVVFQIRKIILKID